MWTADELAEALGEKPSVVALALDAFGRLELRARLEAMDLETAAARVRDALPHLNLARPGFDNGYTFEA